MNETHIMVLRDYIGVLEDFIVTMRDGNPHNELAVIPYFSLNSPGVKSACVDKKRFLTFLQGEIQALNLELHTLGVELPVAPTNTN